MAAFIQTVPLKRAATPEDMAAALPVIVNALGDTGLDPGRVEFEITESVLLHNSAANIGVLDRIRSDYVDRTDDHKLMKDAIRGMVAELDALEIASFLTGQFDRNNAIFSIQSGA